jgi:hypothetical protein
MRKASKKAVRKVVKKKTATKKPTKKFSVTELKSAAKQLGSRGGKATARKNNAKKISKRNKWLG